MTKNQLPEIIRVKGFSLIEAMVALLLGSFVIAMTVQFAFSNKSTYLLNDAVSSLQQNARFSLDFFGRELRLAGYAGCVNTNTSLPTVQTPGVMPVDFNQSGAIRGYRGAVGNFSPPLPGAITITAKDDTDAILIQRTRSLSLPLTETMIGTGGEIVAQGSTDPSLAFNVGDLAVISNCFKLDIFDIAGFAQNAGETRFTFDAGHNLSEVYSTDASVAKLESYVFFIEESANGRPFLSRLDTVTPGATPEQAQRRNS